jgi:hypothetical protein
MCISATTRVGQQAISVYYVEALHSVGVGKLEVFYSCNSLHNSSCGVFSRSGCQ